MENISFATQLTAKPLPHFPSLLVCLRGNAVAALCRSMLLYGSECTHIYIYIYTSFMSQHKSCANCGCQMVKGQLPNRWPSPEYNFTYSVDQKGMKRVPLPTWPNHFVSRYFLFNLLTRATPEFLTEFWMLLENKIRFRVSVFQFSIQKQHALGFSTSSVLKEYQHR